MRDLKRSNAKVPAYLLLASMQVEVFTPMKWVLRIRAGKRVREQIPFISDLLFVHDTAEALNPIVSKTPTLQYRYRKGGAYCEPVTVHDRISAFLSSRRNNSVHVRPAHPHRWRPA